MANQINIQVGADIKNLQEGIKTAVSTIEKGGKDMTDITNAVTRLTTSNHKTLSQAYRQTSKDVEVLALHLGVEAEATKQAAAMAQLYGSQLSDLRSKIAGIDMNNQPVQKAASGFNSLGNSINQITRELPAFTYSMQTGFMAISNNVPILFDEISKIIAANKALAASGQPVQSTLSQLAGSFFTVSTALSLAVTAATMFGPALINNLIPAKETVEELEKLKNAMKSYNDEIDKFLLTEQELAVKRLNEAYASSTQKIKDQLSIAQMQIDITKRSGQEITSLEIKNVNDLKNKLLIMEDNYQKQLSDIKAKHREKNKLKEEKFITNDDAFKVQTIQLKTFGFDSNLVAIERIKKSLQELKPIGTDAFVSLGGEVNKLGVFFDELGEKIGGWANMAANALAGVGVAFGQALMTGDFDEAGKSIVRQLGNIAVQIGAAMIAIGVPQAAVGLPSGFGYIAGGTALTIVGGAMMASGVAPNSKNSGGGGNDSMGSSMPAFTPDFAASSQYLMLDSRVRGTDIIISADNQRRQNRRIR